MTKTPDYGPHRLFDVYRINGEPVTITPAHCAGEAEWTEAQRTALLHAWGVRCALVALHTSAWGTANDITLVNHANLSKSRLMGRMMYEGLPPLQDKPPHYAGGPDYSVAT